MTTIKQKLLEAVIEMHGGMEPLKEILLNEIGDTPEGRDKILNHFTDNALKRADSMTIKVMTLKLRNTTRSYRKS